MPKRNAPRRRGSNGVSRSARIVTAWSIVAGACVTAGAAEASTSATPVAYASADRDGLGAAPYAAAAMTTVTTVSVEAPAAAVATPVVYPAGFEAGSADTFAPAPAPPADPSGTAVRYDDEFDAASGDGATADEIMPWAVDPETVETETAPGAGLLAAAETDGMTDAAPLPEEPGSYGLDALAVPPAPAGGGALDLAEPIGPAPPEPTPLLFLRQQSVLLEKGETQVDFGLGYAVFEEDVPAIFGTTLGENRFRSRLLIVPLALRHGLTDRVQFSASLPVGWAQTDVAFPAAFDESTNEGGIGDLDLALNIHLHRSNGCEVDPDIVFTIGGTVPTSDADFFDAIGGTTALNLGDDFGALRWDLLFIHTYDPVVLFYGFGSRHRFTRDFGPFQVEPGDQYLYQLGVGFAVNDRITLSGRVAGQHITEVHIDGDSLEGSIQEPLGARFAVTVARPCYIVEPFVEIGMTRDSPEAFTGVVWTY